MLYGGQGTNETTKFSSPDIWGSTPPRYNCVGHLKVPPEVRFGLGNKLVGTAQTLRLETYRTEVGRASKVAIEKTKYQTM